MVRARVDVMARVRFRVRPRSDVVQYSTVIDLLLLVCVSFTIIGQPRNSVLIRRV